MSSITFDDIVYQDNIHSAKEQDPQHCGNMDGSILYEPIYISIVTGWEVKKMSINTNQPLTVGWAIGLCVTMLVSALGIAGGTYALIHSDVSEVRTSIDSVRDGASSDVSSLRADMRQDFNRVDNKLDAVASKMDDKIESAAKRSEEKLDKLTDTLEQMRRK